MRRPKGSRGAVQLGLFDDLVVARPNAVERAPRPSRDLATPAESSIISIRTDDLPCYPSEVIDLVERSLQNLPSDSCWFTYKDIRRCFGVSRATIARRLKDGLVPGVRFCEGRMLEDGAVRRLDREQLRWLLLAVRGAGQRARLTAHRSTARAR